MGDGPAESLDEAAAVLAKFGWTQAGIAAPGDHVERAGAGLVDVAGEEKRLG